MAKEKTYTKHMSLKEILSYSIGLFGFQAVIFYINSYAAEFYSRTMGANIAIVGVILLVAKVVSAVFDPVVGNMIEKQTGGKYGKLKPFIFWSIPFLIVLTILCFVKLPVSGVPMYIIIFVLFTLWSMAMTLGDVPSQGIAAVLTPDITERTNMLSIANTFKSIGQAAPYVVVPVIAWIIPGGLDGFNPGYMSSAEYLVSAIFIAVVGCAMLSMICFFNKERVPYQAEKMTFKEMFGALKGNKPLVLVLVSYFLGFARQGAMAIQVQASTVIFGTPSKIIILGITTAAGTMISMAMTPLLIKKFDEKKVFIGMSVYGFVISFVSYFATVASNYNMIVMLATLFLLPTQTLRQEVADRIGIVVDVLVGHVKMQFVAPEILITVFNGIAHVLVPNFPHDLFSLSLCHQSLLPLFNKPRFKAHADRQLQTEVCAAHQFLPQDRQAFLFTLAIGRTVTANIGFVKSTGHFGERHRKFRFIGRHITHHPIVECMSQFMSLLQHRTETPQIGRENTRLLQSIKAGIKCAARLLRIDSGIKPMVLKHHVNKGRNFWINLYQRCFHGFNSFFVRNIRSLPLRFHRNGSEKVTGLHHRTTEKRRPNFNSLLNFCLTIFNGIKSRLKGLATDTVLFKARSHPIVEPRQFKLGLSETVQEIE